VDEIKELKREGLSIRAISRLTGYDSKTSGRFLLAPSGRPVYGQRPALPSKLEPFKPYLKERLQAGVWNAQVLMRELRERNFNGGYSTLTEWLRPQRKDALTVAVRRFETPPGKQAQVDWGHLGSLPEEGVEHMLWGFTITLGYCRMMMAEAAMDQKLGALLRMHEAAFLPCMERGPGSPATGLRRWGEGRCAMTPIKQPRSTLTTLSLTAIDTRLEALLESAAKKEPSYADFLAES
jgi:transposase